MTRPNLLIIMSDQHNQHVLGCAGDPHVRTPNLDALAARGVKFDSAYCSAPLCVPSRMGFLTGRSPSDLGVWTNECALDPETPTFAHQLALAGSETVMCGRMHFPGPDQHRGFVRRLVGDVSGARDESQPLFERRIPLHTTGQTYPSVRDSGPGRSSYIAYDDDVIRRACQYLQQREKDQPDRPFCMVVGCLLPHNPYICPRPLFEQYMDSAELPGPAASELEVLHPAIQEWRRVRGVGQITPEDARRARAAYFGLVTRLDGRIGELLAALGTTGFAADTVVVYTSDHGDMAGEHGMWWKDCFYEGAVRVPMIWSWPGRFRQGAEVPAVTSLLDVGPTCLELTGAEPLPGAAGRSLLPMLESEVPADWPDTAIAECFPHGLRPARMIRQGRWKLIHYHGYEHPQLFDLELDPGEQTDLGRCPEHGAVRDALLARAMDGWSGAAIERTVAARRQARRIVHDWEQTVPPGESEIWRVPPGTNEFDPPQ